jgi:hypothetical protein
MIKNMLAIFVITLSVYCNKMPSNSNSENSILGSWTRIQSDDMSDGLKEIILKFDDNIFTFSSYQVGLDSSCFVSGKYTYSYSASDSAVLYHCDTCTPNGTDEGIYFNSQHITKIWLNHDTLTFYEKGTSSLAVISRFISIARSTSQINCLPQ